MLIPYISKKSAYVNLYTVPAGIRYRVSIR